MQTDKKLGWCANGKPGYDIQTGKPYTPMHACKSHARLGHIFCDRCREESGGLLK